MMNETVKNLLFSVLEAVLIIVIPLLAGYLTKAVSTFMKAKKEKVKDERLRSYIEIAESLIIQSVNYVSQTFVDALKNKGEFTKQKQEEAFNKAKENFLTIVPKDISTTLTDYFEDFDSWVGSKIEQNVHIFKK